MLPTFIYKDPKALTELCKVILVIVSWGILSGDACFKGLIVVIVLAM